MKKKGKRETYTERLFHNLKVINMFRWIVFILFENFWSNPCNVLSLLLSYGLKLNFELLQMVFSSVLVDLDYYIPFKCKYPQGQLLFLHFKCAINYDRINLRWLLLTSGVLRNPPPLAIDFWCPEDPSSLGY